jgi:curved DNA-binding protein CbpA
MNGQLHEHPLAELIHEIAVAGLSGSLRLARERVKLAVYFEEGRIVYATSNLRGHRLAECLRRWNIPAMQKLTSASEKMSDMELGIELVAKNSLSRDEFEELLARQAVEVLRPALLWTEGGWEFDPRVRLTVEVKARVEVRELLVESARRIPQEFIAGRFKNAEERLSPASLEANGLKLMPVEGFILSRIDGPIALSDLTTISGMPEEETMKALYALVIGGLINRDNAQPAFTPEQLERARAVKAAPARIVPAPSAAKAEAAAAPDKPKETTGPRIIGYQPNEVDVLFARLDEAENYYHVLDLSRDAEASEIKRAYHSLAKRFHPDRFHKDADPKVYSRIEDAFARISQAYETLKDQRMRAAYDRSLGARANTPTPKTDQPETPPASKQGSPAGNAATTKPGAEPPSTPWTRTASKPVQPDELYQQGLAALQQGNQTLALNYLAEAARLAPKQARYRAQYGRALAAGSQTRHQAEAEFQAAIALDKGNVYYRVMLARLYMDTGMMRRAMGELERALSIDPKSEAARLLLDKLKSKG